MPSRSRKDAGRSTRPIRTKRDYEGAKAVVKRISGQADRDSTAELRLQSLLQELDKFEEPADEAEDDGLEGTGYAGPRRRWSDD